MRVCMGQMCILANTIQIRVHNYYGLKLSNQVPSNVTLFLTACVLACLPAWLPACLPGCLPACLPACLLAWWADSCSRVNVQVWVCSKISYLSPKTSNTSNTRYQLEKSPHTHTQTQGAPGTVRYHTQFKTNPLPLPVPRKVPDLPRFLWGFRQSWAISNKCVWPVLGVPTD